MANPLYHPPPKPPGIYRAARALRRVSVILLVVLVLYVAFVAYSATQVARDRPSVGPATTTLEANNTVGLTTSFTLNNPTMLPIQSFGLAFRVLNASGFALVDSSVGPATISPGATDTFPVAIYVPVAGGGASLLTQNQYLQWNVWGNATYGYLFSVSLAVQTEKSWGAPFDNLSISVGAPKMVNGSTSVPVSISFTDSASFSDDGTINYQVVPTSGPDCGSGAFAISVPPGGSYSQTQNVAVASGCNPAGGTVTSQYVGSGVDVSLPTEPIP
jgi:hypothetical protein